MAKPFKIFLWIIGGFVVLIAGAAIALPLMFNPNDYKDEIAKAAKDSTGRELTIAGNIKLSVFPWLGVTASGIALSNAKGFGPEPFAQIGSVDARVKILPLLFDHKVEIGTVVLAGLALNLAKSKDGTSNWADLVKAMEAKEPPKVEVAGVIEKDLKSPALAPGAAEVKSETPISLTVSGLKIKDAALSYTDQQAGTAYKLENLSLETGRVELGQPLDLTLAFLATSSKPELSAEVKLALTALANLETKVFEARDLKLDVGTRGATIPGGKQDVSLRTASARYDQNTGALALTDTIIEAAGMVVTAALKGEGLAGDAPKLSGKLSSNTFNPRELTQKLGIALPASNDASALTKVSFASDYSGDFKSANLDNLTLKLDQSTATGFVHVTDFATQAVKFALKMDAIDADRYMAPASASAGETTDGKKEDFRKTELPIAALDLVNAKGTLQIGALTVKKTKLSDVAIELDAPKGKIKTQELKAKLYGGTIAQTARITPGPKPQYNLTAGLDNINSGPLLLDFAGKSYLTGLGDFKLGVNSSGNTVGDVLKALNGAVSTNFIKGAVEGFNLKHKINQAKALYRGEPAPADQAPRTEFSDLKGAGKIVNGVLTTETLKANGADYTLTGDGDVDLAGLGINYVLKPTYTGGSSDVKDLGGLTIPVRITGNLLDPDVKVDLESLLKDKAKTEVKKELRKQEDKLKEKLGDKLGDFFGRPKSQPAPAPEAPPAESTPPSP